MATGSLRSDMLLRPVPAPWLVPLAAVVLTAGAAYCLGYEGLQGGIGEWPGSYVWSAYAVLPWLALFELVKRAEWERDRSFHPAVLALLLVGTGLFSVGLEYLVDWLRGSRSAPVGLQLMRRLRRPGCFCCLRGASRKPPWPRHRRRRRRARPRRSAGSPDPCAGSRPPTIILSSICPGRC